ncbi:MAG TPA: APC family permease [Bryobacteraceae bacterium]|nr:APC family permease [Bryobacteraceae bacterium]
MDLARELGFWEALAINIVSMVGGGIFVAISLVLSATGGPQAVVAWVLALFICLCDGIVWAELAAALPSTGGPYQYLREGFGPNRWGRTVGFLFLWGSLFVMPLVAASVATTFAQFTRYLRPELTATQAKWLAALICVIATALLYRDIKSVGRLSITFWIVVVGTAAWVIVVGLLHFDSRLAFDFPARAFEPSKSFFAGLGAGAVIVAVTLGGYGTICLCAGETRNPERVLPRSIVVSLLAVGLVGIALSIVVTGVLPWREAAKSSLVVSDFIERIHGRRAATVVTVLVLWATAGCLFTSLLSFSRVIYAGAAAGQLFAFLGRVHPTRRFPSAAVLTIGGISAAFCIFELEVLYQALSALAIITQLIPQLIAAVLIRRNRPDIDRPFRMWLYPAPIAVAFAGWLFVLSGNQTVVLAIAAIVTLLGLLLDLTRAYRCGEWPFELAAAALKGHK